MPAFFENEVNAHESAVRCGLRQEFDAGIFRLDLGLRKTGSSVKKDQENGKQRLLKAHKEYFRAETVLLVRARVQGCVPENRPVRGNLEELPELLS